jgi:hypothetical protein
MNVYCTTATGWLPNCSLTNMQYIILYGELNENSATFYSLGEKWVTVIDTLREQSTRGFVRISCLNLSVAASLLARKG